MATILYNPDRKSKKTLIEEFVIRTDIYDDIMKDLESSSMQQPEQHYILVGQRGAGKTTLLNRLRYGIEDSTILKEKVIPIVFSEEQYNISELVNLWETVAQHLEDYHGFENLYEEIETNISKSNFEDLSYDILEKALKNKNNKLILLIDNIGDILKKLDKTEIHRLREILQTNSEIRLIVGSPFYLESILDYHQPFFEFFKVFHLDGLNLEETKKMLETLSRINGEEGKIQKILKETPERVEVLRTLTGGVPRTIALMFNVFVEFNNEDTVKDLEKILDAVTPLYKHRMDDLPTQQQKIVDAVAKNWDGITVKELKDRVRLDSKNISAQLNQLYRNQIIDIVDSGKKNKIYFLKERFFNIWYLMRYGRKYDKERVIWLVKFLESWCSSNELEQRIVDYTEKIKEGSLDENIANFYGEVYVCMTSMRPEMRLLLKRSAPNHLANRVSVKNSEIFSMVREAISARSLEQVISLLKEIQKVDQKEVLQMFSFLLEMAIKDQESFWEVSKSFSNYMGEHISPFTVVFFYAVFFNSSLHLLANEDYSSAKDALDILIDEQSEFDSVIADEANSIIVNLILRPFLKRGQFNSVLYVFEKIPLLVEKLKPTYYATLMLSEKSEEVRKMPPEIADKVQEIITDIQYPSKKRLKI